jgi:hypothetical protein
VADAVPTNKRRAIIATAVDQAANGDAKAREWLGSHLIGKPTGNALLKLAAAEQVVYDPVEHEAEDLHDEQTFFEIIRTRVNAGNARDLDAASES